MYYGIALIIQWRVEHQKNSASCICNNFSHRHYNISEIFFFFQNSLKLLMTQFANFKAQHITCNILT
jgi:hypothetical protein